MGEMVPQPSKGKRVRSCQTSPDGYPGVYQRHAGLPGGGGSRDLPLEEKDLSGEALCKKVQGLFENPDTIPTFAANAKKMAILDANERIYHIIKEIIK